MSGRRSWRYVTAETEISRITVLPPNGIVLTNASNAASLVVGRNFYDFVVHSVERKVAPKLKWLLCERPHILRFKSHGRIFLCHSHLSKVSFRRASSFARRCFSKIHASWSARPFPSVCCFRQAPALLIPASSC